ncbi:MAG: shikimate dehydrogenase [Rhizobiaceae bacterium]|nr:MAG: shikimate dehydrogenase [Rhizobiaceae bacterium]
MAETTRRAFVCGHPVAHSRSPVIHNYWLRQLGLAGSYEKIDVPPDEFGSFLRDFQRMGFVGGNVTLPHKAAAFALASETDEAARLIGAVNTLWVESGKIRGANTDAPGFLANLDDRAPQWRRARAATVLGAGGAARAVVYALKASGMETVRIVNRTAAKAAELAEGFAPGPIAREWNTLPSLLRETDLLVNATSLGMGTGSGPEIDLAAMPAHAVVADIVYIPLETPLLRNARARGLTTVDGLGMLLHQAVPGFARWFGKRPQVTEELRQLVIADLGAGK